MVAAGIDEDVTAVVGRADAEPIGSIVTDQFRQTHADLGAQPAGRVGFSGCHVEVGTHAMNPNEGNRMCVLEDPVDVLGGDVERGRFEYLSDPGSKGAHGDQVGFDGARWLIDLCSLEHAGQGIDIEGLQIVDDIEAVDQVDRKLQRHVLVMRELHLTPYNELGTL